MKKTDRSGPDAGYAGVLRQGCLTGLSCVVTGAGTGIGRTIALQLCALGASVAGIGRRPEPLSEVGAYAGPLFTAHSCDIRDRKAAAELIEAIGRDAGIDVLVNNAGGQFAAPAKDISPRGWDAVIDLNLTALFSATQAAFPHLALRGGGSVINMSLTPVERGASGFAHAIAARAGVLGLTRTLAVEWAPQKIRLNCIAPGVVATDAYHGAYPCTTRARLEEGIPLGRCTTPQEVAELVSFLASPAGAMITGQLLQLDGGMSLTGTAMLQEADEHG